MLIVLLQEKGKIWLKYCKALLAGIFIGVGGTVYLRSGDALLSPFLFSIGLIGVERNHLGRHIADYALMLLCNLLGAVAVGWITSGYFGFAGRSMEAKLAQTPLQALALGFGCGMMMYLAVSGYKKTGSLLMLILPVAVFIFCGFDHCIADAFYFASARVLPAWYYFPMVILGNTLGALFVKGIATAKTE